MPPAAIASSVVVDHRQRLVVAAQVHAQQELERRGRRELRRAAEAAPLRVELARAAHGRPPRAALGQRLGRRRDLARRARAHRRAALAVAGDVAAPLAVGSETASSTLRNARHPVARLRREVRAAEERLALGREEDRHRPAALARQRDDRVHVERVDVGPLLAVDLDVDEALVHEPRRLVVLERLVLHHVAPVARRVADREQDRLVLGPRPLEGLVAPRVPVDRVVRVLEEVGAGLFREPVHPANLAA